MKSGVSLQQMLAEVKRQSESKEDYLIAPNRLRMESYGKEMFLHLSDDSGTELIEPMTITGIGTLPSLSGGFVCRFCLDAEPP